MKYTLSLCAAALLCSQPSLAEISDLGSFYSDIKLRYEHADIDDPADNDKADTALADIAVGFKSAEYAGFSVLAEYEAGVLALDDFAPENPGYDVIADPQFSEWNRAQLQYKQGGFQAVVGRQRLIFDNARFIGNVGWRANEQTYDAASLRYQQGKFTVQYAYIDEVHSILKKFDADTDSHLLNASYQFETLSIGGYSYLLEDDDSGARNDTTGLRIDGSVVLGEQKLTYRAEYAQQRADTGGADFDADYLVADIGTSVSGVSLTLGNERLGSDDGQYGFQTPLATKHAFNGWADVFLATPANGLDDRYLKVGGKLGKVKLAAHYHDFAAMEGSDRYGDEIDLLATMKLAERYTVGAKFADYSAKDLGNNTRRFWLWLQFSL